jgi:flagellar basal-body rod modification protein FlgD
MMDKEMQKSIQQLTSFLQSNQALKASALVGRKVLVNSRYLSLGQEEKVKATVEIPLEVANIMANIYSCSNRLICKIPLNASSGGLFEFSWNGNNSKGARVSAGRYRLVVTGNHYGNEVKLKTMVAANVNSVSLGQDGEEVRLHVAGIGLIPLSDVTILSY